MLGFGSTHYEDWRGPDGKLYGRANVIVNKDGRPYLATPKVRGGREVWRARRQGVRGELMVGGS